MKRRKLLACVDLRTNNTVIRMKRTSLQKLSAAFLFRPGSSCLEDLAFHLRFYLHADPPIGGGGLTCSWSSLKLPP